jgi:rod shape-determining protein MreC
MVAENRRMAEELVHLRRQVRELSTLDAENETLRGQLGFRRAERRPMIPVEVIARDAAGWWQTVRIDRGAADGLRADLAVVTSDGLAGRVIELSARTADALLISDPNSRVSARLPRTDAAGILVGAGVRPNGQAACRLDFIHRHLPIKPGDEVVTSGLGGVFPRGLLIGYVERVFTDEQGLYRYAEVIPRADLGAMRYAFVLTDEGAAPAATEETP